MKSGMMGGTIACCLLVIPFLGLASDISIHINDVIVSLAAPPIAEADSLLVPLVEFGALIGIDVKPSDDGHEFLLRWPGRRATYDIDVFSLRQGVHYAWLSWLVGLVEGALHRVGDAVYVEADRATLLEIEADADRIILRFDRYTPDLLVHSDAMANVSISLSNCGSELPPQRTLLGGPGFESVQLHASGRNRADLTVRLAEPAELHVVRHEAAGYYSLRLEPAAFEESESIIDISIGTTLHELSLASESGSIDADFLTIDTWRSRYRLLPAYPTTGLGSGERVDSIAREAGADLAIGVTPYGASPSVLVIDGVPLINDSTGSALLTVDFFGRWDVGDPAFTVCAEHTGGKIPIDDVNRPMVYGKAVAYTPGYDGTLVRGIPGSFRVIKVRSDRVVSVYEGPFVSADSSATLIVASGEAKARFSLVELGDPIRLGCDWSAGERTIVHAFETRPMLLRDGIVEGALADTSGCCAALATDWHGGMTLLSLSCDAAEGAQDMTEIVLAILDRLEAPVRNVAVLSEGGPSTLVVRNAYDFDRLGAAERYTLALCLVPLTP